ncbi:MAG: hypothetical protein ACI8Q6_003839 [Granulosicoccus sp.]|jgi:hypothetical protein
MRETGTDRLAHSVIPSFTNPNKLSIATGRPPSVHGICGNFLFDPDTGEEVMMNDVRSLRALLGAGLKFDQDRARCFSAEKSDTSTTAEHGQEAASTWLGLAQPEVNSADLSEFLFAAGVKLLADWQPDVMYLTTTDYVPHKYATDHADAKSFYEMFDKYLTQLDAIGAAIVVTADHGMKPKHLAGGSPAVVYVQDLLDDILYEAGSPHEMFQIVTGVPQDIGDEMCTNKNIDIITFIGGVPVGKIIAAKAGYKRTALELGGNDPLIICNDLSDADLGKAATIAVAGATGNSGQRCTAVKRILVQESVADRFVPLVLEKAKPPKCSKTGYLMPKRRAQKSCIIRAVRARCCRRSWLITFPTTAIW